MLDFQLLVGLKHEFVFSSHKTLLEKVTRQMQKIPIDKIKANGRGENTRCMVKLYLLL